MLLNVIYLRSGGMVLSKKNFASWRDIQDEYEDYMASLGPWTVEEMIDFLGTEYQLNPPFTEQQVRQFVKSADTVLRSAD